MKHQYYECPAEPNQEELFFCNRIFLAGGISGCPDWQSEMVSLLNKKITSDRLEIYNPRRAIYDPNVDLKEQISWERKYLDRADLIIFWFPQETLCPISLYELGRMTLSVDNNSDDKSICIGCHPNYARREDIFIQTELSLPEIEIVDSLDKLSDQANRIISEGLTYCQCK